MKGGATHVQGGSPLFSKVFPEASSQTQRCVSTVILNPIRLTIIINNYKFKEILEGILWGT